MFYRIFIFLIVLTLFSCSKVKRNNVKLISHAGDGLTSISSTNASNSKEAIDFVLNLNGCDGVELDVHLSKDGELWLFHDQNMREDTGVDFCINQLTYEELKDVTYKTLNNEKLVRIIDVDFSQFEGKHIYFDIRHANECEDSVVDVNDMITALLDLDLPDGNEYYYMTFNQNWIEPFIASGLKTMYIGSVDAINSIIDTPGLYGVETKFDDIGDFDIKEWQSKVEVGIYGFRTPKTIRKVLRWQPDFVETDNIQATINISK